MLSKKIISNRMLQQIKTFKKSWQTHYQILQRFHYLQLNAYTRRQTLSQKDIFMKIRNLLLRCRLLVNLQKKISTQWSIWRLIWQLNKLIKNKKMHKVTNKMMKRTKMASWMQTIMTLLMQIWMTMMMTKMASKEDTMKQNTMCHLQKIKCDKQLNRGCLKCRKSETYISCGCKHIQINTMSVLHSVSRLKRALVP